MTNGSVTYLDLRHVKKMQKKSQFSRSDQKSPNYHSPLKLVSQVLGPGWGGLGII